MPGISSWLFTPSGSKVLLRHFPRNSAGASFLLQGFFLRSVLKISEHEGHANEDQNAEPHLAMDPFFPEFSCGVMYIF